MECLNHHFLNVLRFLKYSAVFSVIYSYLEFYLSNLKFILIDGLTIKMHQKYKKIIIYLVFIQINTI